MQKKYIVYCHTNKINGKKYIGVTGTTLEKRAGREGTAYQGSTYFYSAIKKYGWDNFNHEILFENLTKEQASEKEYQYINLYNTMDHNYGYNLRQGGYEGYTFKLSQETKRKISQKLKGQKKSEIWHQHRKQYYQNHPHPNEGHFGNQSTGFTRKVRCIETGDVFGAIAEAERWCASSKVGECCRGLRKHAGVHPEKGFQLSWEYAENDAKITIICNKDIQERKTIKKIQCINTGQVFENAKEAARFFNMEKNSGNINRCCKGERKSAGKDPQTGKKLLWRYYQEV